jgi:hypothetical protein
MNPATASDTLAIAHNVASGIPDLGTRVVMLVSGVFVLSILLMLIYFRMKEVEEAGCGEGKGKMF